MFSVNAVSWSISAELFFYCILPIIILSGRYWLALAVTGICLIAQVSLIEAYNTGVRSTPIFAEPWSVSWYLAIWQNPLVRVLEFVVGVLAGRHFAGRPVQPMSSMLATIVEIAAIAAVVLFMSNYTVVIGALNVAGFEFWAAWFSQSGGAVVFAALIYVFAHQAGYASRILMAPLMVFLGEISFAMYMVHQIVIRAVGVHDFKAMIGWWPMMGVIAVTIFLASWALFALVEKPARRAIIKAFTPRSDTPLDGAVLKGRSVPEDSSSASKSALISPVERVNTAR